MQQLWLVTIPNNKKSPDTTYHAIVDNVVGSDNCRIHKFTIPPLVVGTLDSLIALSDDLNKINSQVENVVRKVERQYFDIKGSSAQALRVNDTPIETYFRNFSWDFARYQHQGRPLVDIVNQIQGLSSKIDEELKKLSLLYNEKVVNLGSLQRKKTINLSTSDFEDFLKPEQVNKLDLIDTPTLLTVFVVVPKALEKEFLDSYSSIGQDIAAYGGPDWSTNNAVGQDDGKYGSNIDRTRIKDSPVVPGSKNKVLEEGDSVLYTITILKGHYSAGRFVDDIFQAGTFVDYIEPTKHSFREKRFLIREFNYNHNRTTSLDDQIKEADNEVKQVKATITRWCKAHFGESYVAWVHLKVIRGFVESVLRYGLPLDFLSIFIEPNMKKEKYLKNLLLNTITRLHPTLITKKITLDPEEEEDMENLPFVCLQFNVIGVSSGV
mmetsp:Transcript_21444/g.19515  ORF Transcript_21444/g.19515 Transcript_21444/m.19515 type:complete len:436 (+) Transcript_21444:62-1369(+)